MAEAVKVNKPAKGKKTYLQNLIMMLVMAVSIILAVYAWFSNTKTLFVDKVTVNSDTQNSVQQRLVVNKADGTTYDSGWQIESINLQEALGTFQYAADISGNGLSFYRPVVDNQGNPIRTGSTWQLAAIPVANRDYVVYDLYMRSTMRSKVYITPNSYVKPEPTTFDTNLSSFGNGIPKNYIAGAARVAFIDVSTVENVETDTVTKIWVPNKNYSLSWSDPRFTNTYVFNENGLPESLYEYYNGSGTTELTNYVTNLELPTIVNGEITNGVTPVFSLDDAVDSSTNNGFSYLSHYKIIIWIEGTDREANTALAGGNISTHFDFIAMTDN